MAGVVKCLQLVAVKAVLPVGSQVQEDTGQEHQQQHAKIGTKKSPNALCHPAASRSGPTVYMNPCDGKARKAARNPRTGACVVSAGQTGAGQRLAASASGSFAVKFPLLL